MKTKAKSPAQTPKELLVELQALVAEAERMLSDAVGEKSDEIAASLRSRFESARERFTQFCSNTKKNIVAGAKSTDATIRSNPYQALAITLGAGLAAGLLLGRRCR